LHFKLLRFHLIFKCKHDFQYGDHENRINDGRKGDNDDAVTGASKQSKSSFTDNVEIVHASPASKAVKWKSKVAVAEEKYFKRQFQDSSGSQRYRGKE
jgi:hypothetical protein